MGLFMSGSSQTFQTNGSPNVEEIQADGGRKLLWFLSGPYWALCFVFKAAPNMIAIDQFVLSRLVMTSSFWPTKACIFDWLTLCRYPTSLYQFVLSFGFIPHHFSYFSILHHFAGMFSHRFSRKDVDRLAATWPRTWTRRLWPHCGHI